MDIPECNVCNEPLDEDEHQPRLLGCSHDACTTCVRLLIKNGFLECPMCRIVVQASKAEDFHINHGVVQILRLFKGFKVSGIKPKEEAEPENSKVRCGIHEQLVNKGCLSCKVWICTECIEIHTPDIGCEIQEYKDYLKNRKKDIKEKVEPTLLSLRKNLESLSTEFSDLEIKKKDIEAQMETVAKSYDEGTKTLNKFVVATTNVDKASTSIELDKSLHTCNEWHQYSQIWCKKHSDTSGKLLEKIKTDGEMYVSMDIKGKRRSCKLTYKNGSIHQHCFRVNGTYVNKSSNMFTYEHLLTWLPLVRDLVFLDLAICGVMQGRVTIRLRQDLPYYAKNIPLMFTGEEGHSLMDLKCVDSNTFNILFRGSNTTDNMGNYPRDVNAGHQAIQGSVLADRSNNQTKKIIIYFEQGGMTYKNDYDVFGQVEKGLDIVKLCKNHSTQSQVTVIDCGLVIKKDLLKKKIVSI